ncbi:FAD/NAD-P-binding domain-containing protein [Whalleya microplaca]|nr:FAD/NAD-P-binding domain-containing protein [Whalleya microplaca]
MKDLLKKLTIALGVFAYEDPSVLPVCIVGAGPAGLTTAAELELKGKQTVIFEKQDAVGGKCQAVYQDDGFSPLGALIFTPPTYRESIKMIVNTGMTSVPFISGDKYQYNTTSGAIWEKPAPPPGFNALFMQEVGRYISWWNKNFYLYNTAASYRHGIPDEFTITTAAWLAKNQYQVLQVLFIQTMVAYGYGDYRQVPIVYMLQYLTPDVTMALLKVQQGAEVHIADFHKVLAQYAEKFISGPIHLSTSITEIDRRGDHPIIKYRGSRERMDQTKTQSCSAVVMAFPPTLSALEAAGLDLTEDEQEVFAPVGINSFYSGAVRMKTPHFMTFGAASSHPMVPPEPAGEPVVAVKLHEDLEVAITSSWGPYRGNMTKEEAYARLKSTLSKFNKDPRDETSAAVRITDDDVLAFQENDYFPHFDEDELAMGYYEKFERLQGQRKTYYASGFNMFELVEYAIRAGQDVVRTYF